MSYREILLTAQIMDEIFAQIYPPEIRAVCSSPRASCGGPQPKRHSRLLLMWLNLVIDSLFYEVPSYHSCKERGNIHYRETLDSVVAQTVLPERWVIIDDGSTDQTAEIVERYAKRYPWIELVPSSSRSGSQFCFESLCCCSRIRAGYPVSVRDSGKP